VRGALLLAIVVLAAGAGCGSETDAESDPAPPRPGDEAGTELEITFWPQGRSSGNAQTWTLTCEPAGGTHRSPEDACARLAALEDPFAPPSPDEICTEQYGGPEEAVVSGTYRGEPVSYELARTNGCEIARFERLGFLLPGGADA
jgi:hypothetical protein